MESDLQLYGSYAYVAVFIVLGYFFKKYPPKKINWIYGYRTRRSMANQTIWDAANAYWTRIFYTWQWYFLLFPIMAYLLLPEYNFIVSVLAHSLLILGTMPVTEYYLDKHFDKNGNPK